MSVTTHQTQYGKTVVTINTGWTGGRIPITFDTRKDALAFLLALRKRTRY
jgi:hypothetical protein